MQFSETPGATRYEGRADGILGSGDVLKSGPPFLDDHFSDFPAVFDAPAGSHWFALGGAYAWTFGGGGSGSGLQATHAYAGGGRRSVTLTVSDDQGATGSRTIPVDVPFEVTGTLTERRCRPAGCQVRFAQGVRVAASGPGSEAATSDGLGGYRLFLTAGSWTLAPDRPAGTSAWDPPSRTLSVGSDLAGQGFARCAEPAGASAAAVRAAAPADSRPGGRPHGAPAAAVPT